METSLYQEAEPDKTQELKKNMFLDLGSGNTKQQKFASLLASPDLNMLKLGSPELEKMLLAQNGLMANTPTPTQFVYPKFVTDEQEAYARGFVEALAQLHGGVPGQTPPGLPGPSGIQDPSTTKPLNGDEPPPTYSTLMPVSTANPPFSVSSAASTLVNMGALNVNTTQKKHQFVPSGLALPSKAPTSTIPAAPAAPPTSFVPHAFNVKEEPATSLSDHTVPSSSQISPSPSSRLTDSPAMSPSSSINMDNDGMPIDMNDQEKIKVERKRARNRIAARKCRTRKLERISRLEEKVNDLKNKNTELAQHATSLNEQVIQLKQQIMDHMKTGCQILMPNVQNL